MQPFLSAQWEKLLTLIDLVITLAAEFSFLLIWFIAQHALKLGFARGALLLGDQYREGGTDYRRVLEAHALGNSAMLLTLLILFVKDLSKLGVASGAEVYMFYKKKQSEVRKAQEGWKSSI